jgi:hypothetical protein
VDRQLQKEGKLTLIERVEDVQTRILLQGRNKELQLNGKPRNALHDIVSQVQEIIKLDCSR